MEQLIRGQITKASMEEIRRVMPKKKLMVFVSSTFDDTHLERDILHKNILPFLQRMGQQHGIQVILYDMRFGVKDENTLRHMTWETCKEAIKQCHEGSDGLFFLSLQADRYGGRLLPKYLDEDVLLKALNTHKHDSAASDRIRMWYIRDANHHPPRYELKHRASLVNNSDNWDTDFPSLRDSDLDSMPFETISGLPETRLLINRSVTEWETLFALGCDKERFHWIQRSFDKDLLQAFSSNPNCSKLTDVIGNLVSSRKLEELRMKMKEHLEDDQRNALLGQILPEDYFKNNGNEKYTGEWEAVARTCLEHKMKKVILKCNQWRQGIYGIPEDHAEEIVHHCFTAFTKSRNFFEREELLQTALEKIRNFKMDEAEEKLFSGISLALIGKSGCGKTAMMSMLALSFQDQEVPR
jgi:hypothetical protein